MESSGKRGPTSEHKSYRSPVIESIDTSATPEELALAVDGIPREAMPGRFQQLEMRLLSHEDTQASTYNRGPQSLLTYSSVSYYLLQNLPETEPEMLSQPDTGWISEKKLAEWVRPTRRDLVMWETKAGMGKQALAATLKKDLSGRISWMDHVLGYGIAKTIGEASDSKSEPNNAAVVRDALGGGYQEPSRLNPSPTRKYLPMMLQGKAIGAQHDTGAEGSNFMTSKLAEDLKLHVRTKESDRKSFSMGTGKVRRAIGRVRAWCAFAKESGTKMKCWFYVLPKLASPLIMGSQFLKDTKTMSHFTHRLADQLPCTPSTPMVNLISSTQQAKRRLVAFIDDRQTYINADSGSHLDLMSSA